MSKATNCFIVILCIYAVSALPLEAQEEAQVDLVAVESVPEQDAIETAVSEDLTRAKRQFGHGGYGGYGGYGGGFDGGYGGYGGGGYGGYGGGYGGYGGYGGGYGGHGHHHHGHHHHHG